MSREQPDRSVLEPQIMNEVVEPVAHRNLGTILTYINTPIVKKNSCIPCTA